MTTTTAPTAPTLADLTDEEVALLAQIVSEDGPQFLGKDRVTSDDVSREAQARAEARARKGRKSRKSKEAGEVADLIAAAPAEALAAHAVEPGPDATDEDMAFTQWHESEIELDESEYGDTDAEVLARETAAEHAVVEHDAEAAYAEMMDALAEQVDVSAALVLLSDHYARQVAVVQMTTAPEVLASVTAEAEAIVEEAAPKKRAKKAACSGSSSYVAHTEEDIVERTAKGRAAYAEVECPGCGVRMRAGVWFSEKGIALRGEEGMAYLSKHTA